MDEETLENVDDLVDHMQSGRKLDPLVIYADGKEDGRHRALAAKKLGLDTVPVIDYRTSK
jgi:ParB-like chromosome segregation protein Spo0J